MATLPKVLINQADSKSAGGVALRVRTQAGEIKYKEDLVDGLDNAPKAFIGMLEGRNFGKLLIRMRDVGSSK